MTGELRKIGSLLALLAIALNGCGGGMSTSTAQNPGVMTTSTGTMTLVIPNRSAASVHRPNYISASVTSAGITAGNLPPIIADLSPTSSLCTSGVGGRTCSVPLIAPLGTPSIAVTLYAGANGTGSILGT